jgi:tetratricopeptide (TPR) repeat protein
MRMKNKKWLLLPLTAFFLTGCQSEKGPDYVALGEQAIENMEYTKAAEQFQSAVTVGKELAAAYRGLGISYMGTGEYQKAAEAFDNALLHTTEKMTAVRRDVLYYKSSALYHLKDYDGTISVCTELISEKPEEDAHYLRGACYMEKGEYDAAKLDFDTAVSLEPEDYSLYLNIYSCYQKAKRTADGDPYLQEALQIQDDSKEARYQKAQIYYYLEEFETARDLLNPLVEKKDQPAMELLGKVYLSLEDMTHARKIYQDCIGAFGATPEYYNGLVLCDLEEQNYDQALENINAGLELSGEEGKQELMYNRIVVWEYLGDFDTAYQMAGEYVEKYPADERGKREYTFLSSR